MNNFENLMLEWATEGEGEDEVRIMLKCYIEEDGVPLEELDPDLIGWNVLDIFNAHYDNGDDLSLFISEMMTRIDDGKVGEAVIGYYAEHM